MVNAFFAYIASTKPDLKDELRRADLAATPTLFVKKCFMSALMLSIVICIFLVGGLLSSMGESPLVAFFAFPFVFIGAFYYFMSTPTVLKMKKEKEINQEIVFATRFLIIETEAGVPLYDCFVNMSNTYKHIGKYFRSIVESVNLGTSMEDAINDTLNICPSRNLQKVYWQILNTIYTGSDLAKPLNSVLDQIIKEQKIDIEEYGRKLTPMAMFYMMVAVIAPSLGTTMMIIFTSFTGVELGLIVLLSIAGTMGFIQFMFFTFIKSARPAVEM